MEGRDFVCEFCRRGYLSCGSLVYHIRQKHNHKKRANAFINSLLKWPRLTKKIETPPPEEIKEKEEPALDLLLSSNSAIGGPIDPLCKFEAVLRVMAESP